MSPLTLFVIICFFYLLIRMLNSVFSVSSVVRQQHRQKNYDYNHKGELQIVGPEPAWYATYLKATQGGKQTGFQMEHTLKQLGEDIMIYFRPLRMQILLTKSIAPPMGLLFTVLGLIVVMVKQSNGLDHHQLLGDMGIALVTTALSSIILIIELVCLSYLNNIMAQDYETGKALIMEKWGDNHV